jgi:translocation and assembly module TamB
MHIRIPDSLPADVPLVEVIEVNGDSTSKGRSLDATEAPLPLLLDLTLATSKPVRISGRGLDSLWTGKLAVAGRVDEPLIRGQLNSERGTLDFAGKTFKLASGNVTFPGTYPIAPTFTAKLLYEKDDFQATIGVSGDSARPKITLSSSPSLPKDEILSRILFNKGVGELSALETLQLARTLAELSGVNIGGSGGGIMDRVQETLSLDVLRIDSGASGATTVSAGKYIQEGVYVGVEQGALASDSSVKVEIDVTPQVSVETKVGQNASGEVGVNWKWDY